MSVKDSFYKPTLIDYAQFRDPFVLPGILNPGVWFGVFKCRRARNKLLGEKQTYLRAQTEIKIACAKGLWCTMVIHDPFTVHAERRVSKSVR